MQPANEKLKVAILGTGNIGTDLLMKVLRSPWLECRLFAGRNLLSAGMSVDYIEFGHGNGLSASSLKVGLSLVRSP